MANGMFDFGRNEFALGNLDWVTPGGNGCKAALVDEGTWTPNLSTDQDYADASGIVGTPTLIANPSTPDTDGACNGDDVVFSTVAGATVEGILVYFDSGVAATSTLICYFDTAVSGLPVTPNGGDITVQWAAATPYIFKL